MDTQNKWNAARKVMKEIELRHVSSSPIANNCAYSGKASANATRGNALEANSPAGMKQMLKAVVEVQYTTGTLEVAG